MFQVIIIGIQYSVYFKVRKNKYYIETKFNFSNLVFTKHLYKKYFIPIKCFNEIIVNI